MGKSCVFPVFSVLLFASQASGLDDVQNFLARGADGAVVLSWQNPAAADYAGVIVRRSTTGFPAGASDGDPVGPFPTGDFPVSQTSYVDDELANGQTYYYAAFAHDNLMNPAAGVTASASTAQAVTNFQAASGDREIALSWNMPTDATPNFVGVVIRRSTDAYPQDVTEGDWIVTVAAQPDPLDSASFVDTNVALFETYYYSAFAHYYFAPPVEADVYGPPVSVDEIPDDLTPPAPVLNFAAVSGKDACVPLSWDMPPYAEDWERVVARRKEDSYPSDFSDGWLVCRFLRPIDDPGTPAIDESCDYLLDWGADDWGVNGQTYYYVVFVLDETGNESAPATVEATPVDVTAPDAPWLLARPVIRAEFDYQYRAVEITWTIDVTVERNWDLCPDFPVVVLRADWPEGEVPADPYPTNPWDDRANILLVDCYRSDGQIDDIVVEVGVTYYYAAWAIDDENPPNVSARATAEATPVDNFPPAIRNVLVTASGPVTPVPTGAKPWQSHEALIEWEVQDLDPSVCEISYGTTTGHHLGTVCGDGYSTDTARSAVIDGLWGGTTVYFRITARDSKGASSTYEDSFDTVLDSSEDTDVPPDGMADDWEIAQFGDLSHDGSIDTDLDGLTDLEEYRYGTDPSSEDTDGDGVPDDEEIAAGSDPLAAPPHLDPLQDDTACGTGAGQAPLGRTLVVLAFALAALGSRPAGVQLRSGR